MIVVDVNVVVHLLAQTDRHASARALWDLDQDWRLPVLWRHELLNVLATMTREGYLDREGAATLWERGVALLAAAETTVDWLQALDLAVESRVSAYDAQYVVLAQALRAPLVTEDARLRKAFPKTCQSLETALSRLRPGS